MRRAPGEGTIKRRTNSRGRDEFVASIPIDEWSISPDGRRRRKFRARVCPTNRAALRALEDLRADRDQGVAASTQTVGDYLRYWLAHRADLRPATRTSYEIVIRRHLEPWVGGITLERLTIQHVEALIANLAAGTLGVTSQRYAVKVLRIALAEAERVGMVPRNVATFARPPKAAPATVEPFTIEQGLALLRAAAGDELEAYWTLVLTTGMRESEALGVTWSDVDLEAGTVRVHHQLARHGTEWTLETPKSAAGVRELALSQLALEALRGRRRQQLADRLAAVRWANPLDLVFTNAAGRPMHRRTVLIAFKGLCRRAEVPERGIKELRHTAASILHAAGASPREIMEQLGHADVRITLQTYTHLFSDAKRKNADRMDDVLEATR